MQREMIISAIVGLIAMLLAPFVFDDIYTLTVLTIYGLLALSLGFVWGFGGILCFGQAAFFGLGAYSFAIAAINFADPWAAAVVALVVPALFAAALGAMLFYGRLSDVYLAVVTLVVTLILFKFMNSTAGSAYKIGTARMGGYNGIPGFDTLTLPWDSSEYLIDESLFYFCALILLASFLALRWLLGRALRSYPCGDPRERVTRGTDRLRHPSAQDPRLCHRRASGRHGGYALRQLGGDRDAKPLQPEPVRGNHHLGHRGWRGKSARPHRRRLRPGRAGNSSSGSRPSSTTSSSSAACWCWWCCSCHAASYRPWRPL